MRNKFIFILMMILAITAVGFYEQGHWFASLEQALGRDEAKGKISYWTCGMHPQVKRDKPGNCPICNMPLIPVYEEAKPPAAKAEKEEYIGCGIKEEGHCPHCDQGIEDVKCVCNGHSFLIKGKNLTHCPVCKKPLKKIAPESLAGKLAAQPKAEKILYYRNPMHPEITSPTPMKDEMGMDYVPVYSQKPLPQTGEEGAASRVRLNEAQMKLAGVNTAPVSKQRLFKQVRTVGRIAFDPELAVAQEELLTALETREKVSQSPDPAVISRSQDILEKSRLRLRLLGMSEEEISQLEEEKKAQRNLVLPEDTAWVYADVYEYDLAWIKKGQAVMVTAAAYAGEEFNGMIKSISPVLDPKTRSVRVRLEIDNPEKKLKPEMYVNVTIESVYTSAAGSDEVLAVPREAVLDTGMRKIVYVYAGEGLFLGKEIQTGPQARARVDGKEQIFYPVLSGLNNDEIIVTRGNFLIDSQSQLTGGMSVLWGGATEIKEEPAEVKKEHKH